MLAIPTTESISPEWFTALLRGRGLPVTVSGFDARRIGTGQIGKCVRYTLQYSESAAPAAQEASAAPLSLIVKYPSDDPTSRATGVMLNNFLKEVRFYQRLQQRLTVRTPLCYFAEIVDAGPQFAVVMEDLAPAEQGDQLAGCDARLAQAAVLELVGLHAPGWCDRSLLDESWLYNPDPDAGSALREMYRAQLPGFLQRYGHALEADERDIIARVGQAAQAPLYAGLPDIFSLVHVDYRLDNLLLHDPGGSAPVRVTVVDWQSISLGAPLNDVAYFLGAGMLPAARAAAEEDIVRRYHSALLAAGVTDFSWPDCWTAYRRGVFAGFGVTVVASMLVQQTERGDQMFTAMARRHARHALDLNGAEFLV